jgi:hypothetical protein
MSGDHARLARPRNAVGWPRETRGIDVWNGRVNVDET